MNRWTEKSFPATFRTRQGSDGYRYSFQRSSDARFGSLAGPARDSISSKKFDLGAAHRRSDTMKRSHLRQLVFTLRELQRLDDARRSGFMTFCAVNPSQNVAPIRRCGRIEKQSGLRLQVECLAKIQGNLKEVDLLVNVLKFQCFGGSNCFQSGGSHPARRLQFIDPVLVAFCRSAAPGFHLCV